MLKKLSIILVLIAAHFCRNICGSLTPPIIDISALITPESYSKAEFITTQQVIINACQEWGFFHIINHGISIDLEDSLVQQMKLFFMSDKDIKNSVKRSPTNSRGFADDELTKQLKDSKEILDIGQVHFSNLSMKALKDQSLDGVNMWPVADHLNQLKPVVDAYYDACMNLAGVLFKAITSQLACQGELPSSVSSAFETHSSFLRLNMYPIVSDVLSVEVDSSVSSTPSSNLGVSRHTDAGVLTLLLQDSVSALEVYSGSKQDFGDGEWVAVDPVPRALTINTGDMLQVGRISRVIIVFLSLMF
jgi:isopenicillin N synthase-like dioxygenase